jgi:deoxycytidylate deaminase
MNMRPTLDEYFMNTAEVVATISTDLAEFAWARLC